MRQFILQKCLVVRELSAQAGGNHPLQFVFGIIHYTHSTEDYHALNVQCPVAFFPITFVHYTIADFIVLSDGVQLVADLCAMKEQFAVFLAIPVIERWTT